MAAAMTKRMVTKILLLNTVTIALLFQFWVLLVLFSVFGLWFAVIAVSPPHVLRQFWFLGDFGFGCFCCFVSWGFWCWMIWRFNSWCSCFVFGFSICLFFKLFWVIFVFISSLGGVGFLFILCALFLWQCSEVQPILLRDNCYFFNSLFCFQVVFGCGCCCFWVLLKFRVLVGVFAFQFWSFYIVCDFLFLVWFGLHCNKTPVLLWEVGFCLNSCPKRMSLHNMYSYPNEIIRKGERFPLE